MCAALSMRGVVSLKQEPIEHPDLTNEDPDYWNKVLNSHGLSMERAARPRIQLGSRDDRQAGRVKWQDRVDYVGSSQDLVRVEEIQNNASVRGGRRVEPSGHRPE